MVRSVRDYGIFLLDAGGHIISWNAGAERIKGYRAEEIIGRHFSTFYPPEDIATDKPGRELRIAAAEGRLEDEGWRVRKDGTRFWANVVITALYDDQGVLCGFGKVTRDLTERRNAERALSERRMLLAHLVQAQEAERRRIAWDVHDDSIQSMLAVAMRLRTLAEDLPPQYAAAVRELDAAVDTSIDRLRRTISRLRPPGIDEQGLDAALGGHLAGVCAEWGLRHRYEFRLADEPPPETSVTIFRIVQEALMNVHKHAEAREVHLTVVPADGGVLTVVRDDGHGRPVDQRPQGEQQHFGLIEMRERAETAGGWWTLHSRPGRGTAVEFWLPLPPATGKHGQGEPDAGAAPLGG